MSDLGNDGHVYKKKWIRMVLHMILIDHNFAMKYVHLLLLRTVDNPPPPDCGQLKYFFLLSPFLINKLIQLLLPLLLDKFSIRQKFMKNCKYEYSKIKIFGNFYISFFLFFLFQS